MGLFDIFKKKEEIDEVTQYMNERAKESIETSFANNNTTYDYNDKKSEFIVEDVFSITGRGTVVTGFINGSVRENDPVKIMHADGTSTNSTIVGIESFRKKLDFAENTNVGLLLRGIDRSQVKKKDKIIIL
ncbi:MAG: hypothetical protein MJ089_02810 [Ruminococcus sp.]|nr:hypothetical protein [Ruminococcus sp.]